MRVENIFFIVYMCLCRVVDNILDRFLGVSHSGIAATLVYLDQTAKFMNAFI